MLHQKYILNTVPHEIQLVYAKFIIYIIIIYSWSAYSHVYQHTYIFTALQTQQLKYISQLPVDIYTWQLWKNVAGALHNVLMVSTSASHCSQFRSAYNNLNYKH